VFKNDWATLSVLVTVCGTSKSEFSYLKTKTRSNVISCDFIQVFIFRIPASAVFDEVLLTVPILIDSSTSVDATAYLTVRITLAGSFIALKGIKYKIIRNIFKISTICNMPNRIIFCIYVVMSDFNTANIW
jgi:hypothetical protein